MRIGLSTSVIERGKTGIAQYVFALTRALLEHAQEHQFTLFVLEEDLSLFAFARSAMQLVPVVDARGPTVTPLGAAGTGGGGTARIFVDPVVPAR